MAENTFLLYCIGRSLRSAFLWSCIESTFYSTKALLQILRLRKSRSNKLWWGGNCRVDSSLPLDYRANPTRLGLWLVGLCLFLGNHLGRVMSIRTTADVVFMSVKLFLFWSSSRIHRSLTGGDKVNSGIGLSNRHARLHGWQAVTTTLCRSWLYPPSRRSRIRLQYSASTDGGWRANGL